jgi:DNA-directed RNA polymerase subunit beta
MRAPVIRDFSRIGDAIEIPDLIEIQQSSYSRFLQESVAPTQRKVYGLESLFREIFPIESYDKTIQLDYLYYELEKPRYTPQECRQLRLTYGYPIKITCRLRKKTGEDMAEQSIYLGEISSTAPNA